MAWDESEEALLLGKPHADRLPSPIARGVEPCIHPGQQGVIDARERRPARNRDQRLLAHGLAARLDAALIVALAGPTETRFQ